MNFQQHSYFKKNHRIPKPEVLILEGEKLFLLAIPWGNRDHTKEYLEKLSNFYVSAKEDNEATSPFPKYSNLSSNLNNLQVAVQLCNQNFKNEINSDEYVSGFELVACYLDKKELGWVSFGGPSIILAKNNSELRILEAGSNWAQSELSNCPSLPKDLIGLQTYINLNIRSIPWKSGDRLMFYYSNQLSPLQLQQSEDGVGLRDIIEANFSNKKDYYYWVAQLDI
jgi:hypothetical protein